MTPRTVMLALDETLTVEEVFQKHPNVPFARIPLFADAIDHITAIIRRRDLHSAMVEGKPHLPIKQLSKEVILFIPENASLTKRCDCFWPSTVN